MFWNQSVLLSKWFPLRGKCDHIAAYWCVAMEIFHVWIRILHIYSFDYLPFSAECHYKVCKVKSSTWRIVEFGVWYRYERFHLFFFLFNSAWNDARDNISYIVNNFKSTIVKQILFQEKAIMASKPDERRSNVFAANKHSKLLGISNWPFYFDLVGLVVIFIQRPTYTIFMYSLNSTSTKHLTDGF